jgi:hypothetical protein
MTTTKPKLFIETKLFAIAMIFGTLAALGASGFFLYLQYKVQAELKTYTPSTQAIKVSEYIESIQHSGGRSSSSYTEFLPCITLKLSENSQPIKACTTQGFNNSQEQAQQFLTANYGQSTGFTVYVSPDKTKASLEGYGKEKEQKPLFIMLLLLVIESIGGFGLYFFLQFIVKKAKLQNQDSEA